MKCSLSSFVVLSVLGLLSACSTPLTKAPIIERLPTTVLEESPRAQVQAGQANDPARVAPPGYYIVKKGDTLIGIALDTGNDWRELAAWNNLENPNRILVGQQLRVAATPGESAAVEIRPVNPVSLPAPVAVDIKPVIDPNAKKVTDKPAEKPGDKVTDKAVDKAVDKPESAPVTAWSWPASGQIIEGFSETRNKGIDIALKAGDPVNAALDGQVVYAGNALRGYGNLIIVKHNPTFLSAYAHNRKLLVKEGDAVKRGQPIAEAGNTDAERVKLHFEIRKGGKPVDPVKYLPAR